MPHKHTRRRNLDPAFYDLPPTAVAKSLPARDNSRSAPSKGKDSRRQKKHARDTGRDGYAVDDTPKAFARLMACHKPGKRHSDGLDDGESRKNKKRKRGENASTQDAVTKQKLETPKILPGERFSDFDARVDRELPVGKLIRKGKTDIPGVKERQTRTEKKLQKKVNAWKEEEARRKEREEEARELAEEEEDEMAAMLEDKTVELPAKGRKGGRKRVIGEQNTDEGDAWEALKAKRDEPKGLHDVVQAPPQFNTLPKEKFKVKGGAKVQVADIPNSAGNLRRREELSEARKSVIEGYRRMMESKRA